MFKIGARYTVTMLKPVVGSVETFHSCEVVEEHMPVVKFMHPMDGEMIVNTGSPAFVKAIPEKEAPVSIQITTSSAN